MPAARPRRGLAGALALLGAFALLGVVFVRPAEAGAALGVLAFFLYRLVIVRGLVCRHHASGMRRARTGAIAEGLQAFQRSEAFWRRHPGLDRRRSWLLGSTAAWPFEALARYNQALCLGWLHRREEALAVLVSLLEDHPGMGDARRLRDLLAKGGDLRPRAPAPDREGWAELEELDAEPPPERPE